MIVVVVEVISTPLACDRARRSPRRARAAGYCQAGGRVVGPGAEKTAHVAIRHHAAQQQTENGSDPWSTQRLDLAAEHFGQLARQREAEAAVTTDCEALADGLKKLGKLGGRDPRAGVGDAQAGGAAVAHDAERDQARGGVLGGVVEQVDQDGAHGLRVGLQRRRRVLRLDGEAHRPPGKQGGGDALDLRHQLVDGDPPPLGPQRPSREPRVGQHVGAQPREVMRRAGQRHQRCPRRLG
jgi:hypothetical protein